MDNGNSSVSNYAQAEYKSKIFCKKHRIEETKKTNYQKIQVEKNIYQN